MPKKLNARWIARDGGLDLTKFPIDSTLTQAVGDDGEKFRSASNSTRGYIDAVLKALRRFPLDLVEEGFQRMLSDPKWSYRMKRKFGEFLEDAEYRHQRLIKS